MAVYFGDDDCPHISWDDDDDDQGDRSWPF